LKVIKAIIIIRNFGIKTVFLSALASADSCGNLQSWDFSRLHAAYILRFLQNCCCTFWMQSHVSTALWALSGQEWIFFSKARPSTVTSSFQQNYETISHGVIKATSINPSQPHFASECLI